MIAKIWKKIGLLILIVACLFNITIKLVGKVALQKELEETADYVKTVQNEK